MAPYGRKQRHGRLQLALLAISLVLVLIGMTWLGAKPAGVGAATPSVTPKPPPRRRTKKPQLVPAPPRLSTARTSTGNTYYYVDSVHGSDSQAGTSPSTAWASLSKLNSIAFAPGDTINLARGSTWTGSGASTGVLTINGAGAAGGPITVQDYGSGAAPTLRNPGGTPSNPSRVVVVQAPYVVVKNLLVRDTLDGGIYLASGADHAVLQNNEATNVGIGFEIVSQYNLITNNYAHDLTMVVNDATPNNDYGAEGVNLQAPNNEVSYNRFVNCKAASIDYGTDGGAVELFGTVDNSTVHHNYAFNDNGFTEVGGGSALSVTIAENEIVQSSPGAGLHAAGDGFASTYANFRFIDNDVVDTSSAGGYAFFFIQGILGSAGQFVIRNSLMYGYDYVLGVQNDSNSPFTHDHNIWRFTGSYGALNFTAGPGESVADPKMVNPTGGDYHLQAGSPAIDTGATPVAYSTDYGGNAIPYGSGPDMGIFEYGSGAAATSTPAATSTRTPTPANTSTPAPTPTRTPTPANTPTRTPTPANTSTPAPTPTRTPTPAATPTRTPTATPAPAAHIGGLSGTSTSVRNTSWKAVVTVTVHDPNHNPLGNVSVNSAWSGGYTGSAACTTGSTGQCSVTSNSLSRSSNETLTVRSLTYPASGGTVISGTNLTSDTGSTSLTVKHP